MNFILRFTLFFILFCHQHLYAISTIASLDLESRGVSRNDALVMTDRLRSELVNSGKYIVVDRENMIAILEEQRFQLSGLASNERVVEIGNILGVQKMLSGSVSKVGNVISVQLQITDVESAQIEHSTVYDSEEALEDLLTSGMKEALRQLLGLSNKSSELSAMKSGFLSLTVQPEEAEIQVDGINYPYNQAMSLEMVMGEHQLIVKKPYFYSYSKSFLIEANKDHKVYVKLVSGKELLEKSRRNRSYSTITSFSLYGLATLSALLAQRSYILYNETENLDDARTYRDQVESFDNMTKFIIGATIPVTVYTGWTWYRVDSLNKLLSLKI